MEQGPVVRDLAVVYQSFRVCKWYARRACTKSPRIDSKNEFPFMDIVLKLLVE